MNEVPNSDIISTMTIESNLDYGYIGKYEEKLRKQFFSNCFGTFPHIFWLEDMYWNPPKNEFWGMLVYAGSPLHSSSIFYDMRECVFNVCSTTWLRLKQLRVQLRNRNLETLSFLDCVKLIKSLTSVIKYIILLRRKWSNIFVKSGGKQLIFEVSRIIPNEISI